jgi:hypothetical protein
MHANSWLACLPAELEPELRAVLTVIAPATIWTLQFRTQEPSVGAETVDARSQPLERIEIHTVPAIRAPLTALQSDDHDVACPSAPHLMVSW